MIQYFTRHRHGVISVVTAITLIGILSFSSLLTEIARYRNLNALYKEMTDSAAFSTLSDYDEDLYKRFALLAINQETDVETYMNCLKTSMNANNEDAKAIDQALDVVGDPEFEKIYDLQNLDVLTAQILESSKYRTGVRAVNDFTNLEGILEDIVGQIAKNLPILEMLKDLSNIVNKLADILIAAQELKEKTESYDKAMDAYDKALAAYNEAIKTRDAYLAGDNSKKKDYTTTVAANKKAVEVAATTLKAAIEEAKNSTDDYKKALDDFNEANDSYADSKIETMLQGIRTGVVTSSAYTDEEKDGLEEVLSDIESAHGDVDDFIGELIKGVDKMEKKNFKNVTDQMEKQLTDLEPATTDGSQGGALDGVDTVSGGLWTLLKTTLTIFETLAKLSEYLLEMINQLVSSAKIFSLSLQMKTGVNLKYNAVYVGDDLPSDHMSEVEYTFEDLDKELVENSVALANKVLETDWPAKTLSMSELEINFNAQMTNVSRAFDDVIKSFENVASVSGIIQALKQVMKIALAIGKFIVSVIQLLQVMVVCTVGSLVEMVYQRLEVAVYSTSMFPNRVSKEDDTNLLGDEWSEYSDNWDEGGIKGAIDIFDNNFSWARAEYIRAGTRVELINQGLVYFELFIFRFIMNLPSLFIDSDMLQIIKTLCSAGPLGILVCVIFIIAMTVMEVQIDLIFLLSGERIPVFKKQYYLSPKGVDDLVDKLSEVLSANISIVELEDGEESQVYDADYIEMKDVVVDNAGTALSTDVKLPDGDGKKPFIELSTDDISWSYETYLTIFIATQPVDTTVKRIADLIQMEMRQMKENKGETTEFKLNEMYTAIRVKTEAEFSPLLPIPSVPTANGTKIKLNNISYAHY